MERERIEERERLELKKLEQQRILELEKLEEQQRLEFEKQAENDFIEKERKKFKIILTPANKFILTNENGEIIKNSNNESIKFETKNDAETYILENLINPKANVGLILMASQMLQQQQQEQQKAQLQAQQKAKEDAIEKEKMRLENIEKQATSKDIIDTKINTPKLGGGGEFNLEFCVNYLIENLKNQQEVVDYFTSNQNLVLMFKEELKIETLELLHKLINESICNHIFSDDIDINQQNSKRAVVIPINKNYFEEIELKAEGGELWIQKAIKEMKKKGTEGAFTNQARREGMDTINFAKKVIDNPKKYSMKTYRRAMFVKNTNPEKFI